MIKSFKRSIKRFIYFNNINMIMTTNITNKERNKKWRENNWRINKNGNLQM